MVRHALILSLALACVAGHACAEVGLPPGSEIGVAARPARDRGQGCVTLHPGEQVGRLSKDCARRTKVAPARSR